MSLVASDGINGIEMVRRSVMKCNGEYEGSWKLCDSKAAHFKKGNAEKCCPFGHWEMVILEASTASCKKDNVQKISSYFLKYVLP